MRHGVDENDPLIVKARALLTNVETAQHRAQVQQESSDNAIGYSLDDWAILSWSCVVDVQESCSSD
eukprot:1481560-Amphidinium_carterae.1